MTKNEKKQYVQWVDRFLTRRKFSQFTFDKFKKFMMDKHLLLKDLPPLLQTMIVKKVFYFKFHRSTYNARVVRCGRLKTYKDIKYMLGEDKGLIRRLKKHRPDLYYKGLKICEDYINSMFDDKYAPSIHRPDRKGNYIWHNIDILTVADHYKENRKEAEQDKKEREASEQLVKS